MAFFIAHLLQVRGIVVSLYCIPVRYRQTLDGFTCEQETLKYGCPLSVNSFDLPPIFDGLFYTRIRLQNNRLAKHKDITQSSCNPAGAL